MKKMLGFVYEMREMYEEGIEMISESWQQIAHITCIMGVLAVLWNNPEKFHAAAWSIILAVYLLVLAAVGCCKFWDVGCNKGNGDKIQSLYFKVYVLCCVLLGITGCLWTGVPQTAIVVGVIVAVTALFYFASEVLFCSFIHFDGKKGFFEKIRDLNPNAYATVYLCLLLMMILVPLTLLNVSPITKVILGVAYTASWPIIALLADNGFDIAAIFD